MIGAKMKDNYIVEYWDKDLSHITELAAGQKINDVELLRLIKTKVTVQVMLIHTPTEIICSIDNRRFKQR